MVEREEAINWRNLIAACAAVCVFAFSLGEIFPLLSLSMEADGVSPRTIGFNTAMAPVGILVAGPNRAGPVIVAFAGGDHDWAAVELGARYSRAIGAPLVLAGALTGISGRDASRLLADASIAVQRALGVAARPLLVRPDPTALVDAARDARLVVVGLTERWRHEGVGPVRTALATSRDHPTLLVRRGLRNNGWAARDAGTRFTWTIAGSG